MKVDVLVAEIGSTTTVVNAFKDLNTDNPIFWQGHQQHAEGQIVLEGQPEQVTGQIPRHLHVQ